MKKVVMGLVGVYLFCALLFVVDYLDEQQRNKGPETKVAEILLNAGVKIEAQSETEAKEQLADLISSDVFSEKRLAKFEERLKEKFPNLPETAHKKIFILYEQTRRAEEKMVDIILGVYPDMDEGDVFQKVNDIKDKAIKEKAQRNLPRFKAFFLESFPDFPEEALGKILKVQQGTFFSLGKYLPLLLKGSGRTLFISIISMSLAIPIGLGMTIVRLYVMKIFSFMAKTYVEIFRGTPLLVQLYIIYFGLPDLGITLDAYVAGIIGLGLNYAAYEAEIYRAGISAIPKGQMEAAMSLGMSKWQAIFHVILPQAIKITIPPVTNDFIALLKDSCQVSVITVVELTKQAQIVASSTNQYAILYGATALIYFLMSYPLSILALRLERSMDPGRR